MVTTEQPSAWRQIEKIFNPKSIESQSKKFAWDCFAQLLPKHQLHVIDVFSADNGPLILLERLNEGMTFYITYNNPKGKEIYDWYVTGKKIDGKTTLYHVVFPTDSDGRYLAEEKALTGSGPTIINLVDYPPFGWGIAIPELHNILDMLNPRRETAFTKKMVVVEPRDVSFNIPRSEWVRSLILSTNSALANSS